jgi:streptogramin lyase
MDPSGKAAIYPTPTPNSGPRRMNITGDEIWFAENRAQKIGVFNIRKESSICASVWVVNPCAK